MTIRELIKLLIRTNSLLKESDKISATFLVRAEKLADKIEKDLKELNDYRNYRIVQW